MTWTSETSRIGSDSRKWQPLCGPSPGLSFHPTQLCLLLPHGLCPGLSSLHKARFGLQGCLLFGVAFHLLLPLLTAPHSRYSQPYFPEGRPQMSQLCFSVSDLF